MSGRRERRDRVRVEWVERQRERRQEIDSACFRYFCDWWIMEVFLVRIQVAIKQVV